MAGKRKEGRAAEETAAVVSRIGSHHGLSHSQPDNILPAELLIPAADIRNAASAALTPADWARYGRNVKGVKRAKVATPSARATSRKVVRPGLSSSSLLRNIEKNI